MGKRGRPRKPSAIRRVEGNRSRTDIPPDLPLSGLPECPDWLAEEGKRHFRFVSGELGACGVVKRIDGEALGVLSDCYQQYRQASSQGKTNDAIKWLGKWLAMAGKFGLTPADRASLMAGVQVEKPDEDEQRFFTVTG